MMSRSENIQNDLSQALNYQKQGDYEQAILLYQSVLDQNNEIKEIHYIAGLLNFKLSHHEQSIHHFKKVMKANPYQFDSYLYCALSFRGILEFEQSNRLLKNALELIAAKTIQANRFQMQKMMIQIKFHLGVNYKLEKNYNESRLMFEPILDIQPQHVDALNELGLIEQHDKNFKQSIHYFVLALRANKEFFQGYMNAGITLKLCKHYQMAHAFMKRALELHPDSYEVLVNMGNILHLMKRTDESIRFYQKALSVNPNQVEAYLSLGFVFYEENKLREAKKIFEKGLLVHPGHSRLSSHYGFLLLKENNYKEGFLYFEKRFEDPGYVFEYPVLNDKLWQGDDLTGKRLLVICEQGYGDSIQFIRYVDLIPYDYELLLFCPEKLKQLFSQIKRFKSLHSSLNENIDYDKAVYLMSLPHLLGIDPTKIITKFPYLIPRIHKNKLCKTDKKKIGFVHQGNQKHSHDHRRSIDFKKFQTLFDCESAMFYSFQFGSSQLWNDFQNVIDLTPQIKHFHDTSLFLQEMDLIISVDTALAHLAGALNQNVWLLLPEPCEWRWPLTGEKCFWYPSMTIFRQGEDQNWNSVLEKLKLKIDAGELREQRG